MRAAPDEAAAGTQGGHEVLGDVALVGCDAPAALHHYRAMAVAGRAAGYPAIEVSGLAGEAPSAGRTGRSDEGVRAAESAMALAWSSGNPSARIESRYALGEVLGDINPARAVVLLARPPRWPPRWTTGSSGRRETAAAAIGSRHGEPVPALADFRDVLALWRQAGNDTLQVNALRNLVALLGRVAPTRPPHWSTSLPPARVYPAEAARLDRARRRSPSGSAPTGWPSDTGVARPSPRPRYCKRQ